MSSGREEARPPLYPRRFSTAPRLGLAPSETIETGGRVDSGPG